MEQQIEKLQRRVLVNDIFLLILIGIILNISVIIFNDNKMPVYFHIGEEIPVSKDYIVFNDFDQVNYPYLGDIIKIGPLRSSIGDILVFSGGMAICFIFIQGIYQRRKYGIVKYD